MLKSFNTTVATPRKWPGRCAPPRRRASRLHACIALTCSIARIVALPLRSPDGAATTRTSRRAADRCRRPVLERGRRDGVDDRGRRDVDRRGARLLGTQEERVRVVGEDAAPHLAGI